MVDVEPSDGSGGFAGEVAGIALAMKTDPIAAALMFPASTRTTVSRHRWAA